MMKQDKANSQAIPKDQKPDQQFQDLIIPNIESKVELQFGENQFKNFTIDIKEAAELTEIVDTLNIVVPDALKEIKERLNLTNEVTINISFNPDSALLQTGVGGYAPSQDTAFIYLDPLNENFNKNFETELRAILSHELHHCKRWENPGYGNTLREALVSEGLAQYLESEMRNGTPPFYATALNRKEINAVYEQMQTELDSKSYNWEDHYAWFIKNEGDIEPHYKGYTVGYDIVKKYLAKTGEDAASLVSEPASSFFK